MTAIRHDIENQLSVAQAFPGAATVSQNAFQKGSASQRLDINNGLALAVYASVAAVAGGNATLECIQADNAALTTNVEVVGSLTVPNAELIPGREHKVPISRATTRQFIGFRHTGTAVTLDVYLMSQDDFAQNPLFSSPIVV